MFWIFGVEACGILAPRPGIEPAPPALEGDILSTGPPGKSLFLFSSLFCSFQDSGGKTYRSEAFLLVRLTHLVPSIFLSALLQLCPHKI